MFLRVANHIEAKFSCNNWNQYNNWTLHEEAFCYAWLVLNAQRFLLHYILIILFTCKGCRPTPFKNIDTEQ